MRREGQKQNHKNDSILRKEEKKEDTVSKFRKVSSKPEGFNVSKYRYRKKERVVACHILQRN